MLRKLKATAVHATMQNTSISIRNVSKNPLGSCVR